MQHRSRTHRVHRRRPSKRRWLKVVVFIALALPLAAVGALWMCFDDAPRVVYEGDLSQQSYEKAQEFIESHDPRTVGEGGVQTLVASEDEVNLVVNYAARRFHQAAARVALHPGAAVVHASVPVPSSPFGPWLNVQAVVRESPGLPVVDKLKLGAVRVPSFLADYALERILERYGAGEQGRVAKDMVKHVAFTDSQVKVVYEWRQDLVKRALSTLTSQDDQERFRAYSARLFQTVEGARRRNSMSLAELMTPLFRLAQQRSAEGNAAKENRAAIITLAFFATDRSLSTLIPAAASWPAPVPVTVTLGGRDDLAKHFLVSAALALEGGSALSDAIGVRKEVDDAKRFDRDREGFSFQDLVADKAGARFGSLAVKSPQKIQRGIAAGVKEADFMPPHKDLAENIPEPEFRKRYGGVGAPAYNNVVADIETRVARAPLLR
ncbi:MAG TPA: hypothetical protein VHP37_33735 [Burkholderiales bacterium]|nr:hypothetical protein [Burkholderiales bacterium]